MGFVVRVYGIHLDPDKGLFVSDEIVQGRSITKFPGGGLEYGEGTIDCLKREMMEETGKKFEVLSHYYTTDYFVESAFEKGSQIISIYYLMKPMEDMSSLFSNHHSENGQSFRFIPVKEIISDTFSLTIDRHVASLLMSKHK